MSHNNNSKNEEIRPQGVGSRRMAFGRGTSGEKPKDFKKALGTLLRYLKPDTFGLILVIFLSVVTAVGTAIVPYFILILGNIIESAIANGNPIPIDQIITNALIAAGVIVAVVIFRYLRSFVMATITHRTLKRLRGDINTKINRLPLKYFDKQSYGDVLSRITNDVDTIGQSFNQSVTTVISSFVLMIGLIVMMFISHWQMAFVSIAVIPVSFLTIIILVKFSQKYFKRMFKSLGQMNGHIEEIYSGHEVVLAYGAQKEAANKFEEHNEELFKTSFRGNFFSGLMFPVMNFVANLALVAVSLFGALMFINSGDYYMFGIIVGFMLYVRLFTNTLPELAQVATSIQTAAAASERVFEFLGEEELISEEGKDIISLSDFKGEVEFKNVSFGYEEGNKVINNFSVKVEPGQKIAIVGPTGAGKTTIVNLLMRFYEINEGDILIDGVSIKDMTRAQVASLFAMVLQDTWIFDGTFKDNIIYAKEGVTDEDVRAAAQNAGIDHFIKSQPLGYDMLLDENTSISAGQKQLVTIARAIIENAPMLILDEATSAVDTRTEVLIQEAMDKISKGRTSFIIAHRLSTIKNTDIILVMNGGDIVEQGSHRQLMELGGRYAELYKSQFERV
ncbi:MAG: ABC transporter ATP-binding protein/permease [Firmicutes bacterium]|nr:ABC transporter ATP-binding protein/permease [Bacillota bacterium]